MRKISHKLIVVFSILWFIYFMYSLLLTTYDVATVKKITWVQAKNISHSYGGI